jgi:hypothetical protein
MPATIISSLICRIPLPMWQKALSSVPKDSDALVLVWSNAGSTFRVLHPTQG